MQFRISPISFVKGVRKWAFVDFDEYELYNLNYGSYQYNSIVNTNRIIVSCDNNELSRIICHNKHISWNKSMPILLQKEFQERIQIPIGAFKISLIALQYDNGNNWFGHTRKRIS